MLMMASSAAAGTGMKKMSASAASRRTTKRDIVCLIGILLFAEPFASRRVRLAPSFGSPAVRFRLTRGFASPSHDGFAVVGKHLRVEPVGAITVPAQSDPDRLLPRADRLGPGTAVSSG